MKNNGSDYFLGANTPNGFRGVFADVFTAQDDWQAYIIKGGPGTGKSTLMRRVCDAAQQRGTPYERIWCSSDPQSLDAVILPELRRAIFDGTAPHVLEPHFPGACEQIINTGDAWDERMLFERRSEVIDLTKQCSQHHAQATRLLACADSFRRNTSILASQAVDGEKLRRCAEQLFRKYIGRLPSARAAACGCETKRLLSAVTQDGITQFTPNAEQYTQVLVVDDRLRAPSGMLLACLRDQLLAGGMDIITCSCSQEQDRLEHILIPCARIAISVSNEMHSSSGTLRKLHTGRFLRSGFAADHKQRIDFNRRAVSQFTAMASAEIAQAKRVHDRLETIYSSAMDFTAVDKIADRTVARIMA